MITEVELPLRDVHEVQVRPVLAVADVARGADEILDRAVAPRAG